MLGRKVIAVDVINLTDARYFAARGVDFLLFDLDHVHMDDLLEIVEWVQGPQILILVSEKSAEKIDEIVMKVAPYAIGPKTDMARKSIDYLNGHLLFFEWQESGCLLDDELYQWAKLDTLKSSNGGLLIAGGDEEEKEMTIQIVNGLSCHISFRPYGIW